MFKVSPNISHSTVLLGITSEVTHGYFRKIKGKGSVLDRRNFVLFFFMYFLQEITCTVVLELDMLDLVGRIC